MNRCVRAVALVAALSALPVTAARAEESEPKRTAQLVGIEEYLLPNGLRVVLYPDATAPKLTVNLTVLVGSVHEGAGEAGMAHVFEHVLFHAVEGFPDISAALKDLGAEYNGSTSFDRTNYFETVAATDENLETAIRLEAGRLGRAKLDAGDLEREGKIVESEFDMGASDPRRMVMMGVFGAMFDFHAYSRSPIGTIEDFKSLKIENVRRFYERYYRPDNAVLFVTGKFDVARALALVTKHFGALKGTGEGRPNYTTREPASLGERRFTIRKPGEAHFIVVGYRIPGAAHADALVADVFGLMLAAQGAGPLHEAVVAKGLAGDVNVGAMSLRYASPFLVMSTVPKDKDPEAAEAAILEMVEKGAAGLTEADLQRAKSLLEKRFDDLFNDAEGMAMALSESEACGSWKLVLAQREQLKSVTLESVKAFAAKHVRRENRVVGRFTPDDAAVAVQPEEAPEPSAWDALLSKLPAAGKAVKEFEYTAASIRGALKWREIGPAKVGVLRKEVKGEKVYVNIFLPMAGMKEVFPTVTAGEALAALMTERTKDLAKAELRARLSELKAEIGIGIGVDGANVSVSATKQTIGEAGKLLVEMLRTPVIEEGALKEYVDRTRSQINANRKEPMLIFQSELPKFLFPEGNPRRGRTPDEQIAALEGLTTDALKAFHKEFLGADGALAGMVGDLADEAVAAFFEPVFAGWKAAKPGIIESNEAVEKLLKSEGRVETPGKPSAVSVLVSPIRLTMDSADYSALDAAAWALFQDPLASRIPKKVRAEKALSYMTGGAVVVAPRGDFGMVLLFTMTKPENAGKALDLIRAEMAEAMKGGITEEELAAYKKAYVNRAAQNRSDDARLAGMIVQLTASGRDFGFWEKMDGAAAGLTVDKVNEALRKYLDTAQAGLMQVGDFAGAKEEKKNKKGKEEEDEDGE